MASSNQTSADPTKDIESQIQIVQSEIQVITSQRQIVEQDTISIDEQIDKQI